MERRTFLHKLVRFTIIGGLIWQLWIFIRSLFPDTDLKTVTQIRLGQSNDFKNNLTYIPAAKAFLIRYQDTFTALSAVCTHLGCTVQLTTPARPENGFACPCHGSHYNLQGNVMHGPATKPLPWYALKMDPITGEMILDLNQPTATPIYLKVAKNNLPV